MWYHNKLIYLFSTIIWAKKYFGLGNEMVLCYLTFIEMHVKQDHLQITLPPAKLSATSTSDVVLKVLHQHLKWTFFFVFLCEKKNGCYFCSQLVSQKFLSAVAMNASKGHGRTNVFHTCCCRGWSWREVGVIIRKTHSVLKSNKSRSL